MSAVVEAPDTQAASETAAAAQEAATPAPELVPPVSLEEYVKNFKYVPPDNPEELTMRAETPVLHPEAAASSVPEGVAAEAPQEAGTSSQIDSSVSESEAERPRESSVPEINILPQDQQPSAPIRDSQPLVRETPPPLREMKPPVRETKPDAAQLPLTQTPPRVTERPPRGPVQSESKRPRLVERPPAREVERIVASSPLVEVPPPAKPVIPASPPLVPPQDGAHDPLGLGPTDIKEQKPRTRFLDVAEPTKGVEPVRGGATITGPSFLGLSDAPAVEEEEIPTEVEAEHRGSHWRLWLTAAVLLIFGALGYMEWRSQTNQSNDGPVEVIRTRIRNFKHDKSAESSAPAPSSVDNANAKPDIQVEQQKQAQQQQTTTPNGTPANSNATNAAATASNNPGANIPNQASNNPATTGPSNTPPPTKPTDNQDSTANTNRPNNPADKATESESQEATKQPATNTPGATAEKKSAAAKKSKPSAQADDQEVITRKFVSGADEMAKANNASDSAAEAAWLWKATARGNPDAPVRLADMYVKGDGVPRSCEQAVVLLKTAATKENVRARNRLAAMYASGICVQRNRVEAYRWLSSALNADPNSQWAQQNRDLIWQQMNPQERAAAQRYR